MRVKYSNKNCQFNEFHNRSFCTNDAFCKDEEEDDDEKEKEKKREEAIHTFMNRFRYIHPVIVFVVVAAAVSWNTCVKEKSEIPLNK